MNYTNRELNFGQVMTLHTMDFISMSVFLMQYIQILIIIVSALNKCTYYNDAHEFAKEICCFAAQIRRCKRNKVQTLCSFTIYKYYTS